MRILLLDGNENQAVAAVRSLARVGHEVTVGAETGWSKAGWSRAAHDTLRVPSARTDPERFVDTVAAFAAQQPGTFVLPMTESSTLPLSVHRSRLTAVGARFVLPDHETVLRAFDKNTTRAIAESSGIATPRTCVATTIEEARRAVHSLGLPVVLKAASSEELGPGGRGRSAGAPVYVRHLTQLDAAFSVMRSRTSTVLVQEFVEGQGTGYFVLMNHGEPRAEFAHVRIRDVRPTGSGSAVRESIPIASSMRAAALGILRELGWHGVAMVEFKRRADDSLVFIEVNGRFWNSLALAVHAGIDFPALLAEMVEQGDVAEPKSYRVGLRCRWILGDARHLAAVMIGPPAGFPGRYPGRLATLLAFLKPTPGMRHDNFMMTDPLPGIGDWLHFLGRKLPAAVRARRTS